MWGNLVRRLGSDVRYRPIPTCVGQPGPQDGLQPYHEAYPHVCGATVDVQRITKSLIGLSPRVWGNRPYLVARQSSPRPIPTCVGQPLVHGISITSYAAYPHVCGATLGNTKIDYEKEGLSPRVWGNRRQRSSDPAVRWPIPTCVGQPLSLHN